MVKKPKKEFVSPDNNQLLEAVAEVAAQLIEAQDQLQKCALNEDLEKKLSVLYEKISNKIKANELVSKDKLFESISSFSTKEALDELKSQLLYALEEKDIQTAELVKAFSKRCNVLEDSTTLRHNSILRKLKWVYIGMIIQFILVIVSFIL